MQKIRVAVLRGGPSSEYSVSLKTGAAVLRNLSLEKYVPLDIFIDREGVWYKDGLPRDPGSILENIDVVFNAMHGEYGEDGTVQKLLDQFSVPYTGSGAGASALCMNKLLTKQALEPYQDDLSVLFAKHATLIPGLGLEDRLREIFDEFSKPIVVKPLVGGSSVGVSIVDDYDDLLIAVEDALQHAPKVFLEEYIEGKEATCGVVEGFRGEELYSLLPIEIIPSGNHQFFDYKGKYEGASEQICPGNFSKEEGENIQNLSSEIHKLLGLRHYSRSDFIVTPEGIYFLEVNTLPGMTETSLIPKSLQAIGSPFPQFLDHLISTALIKS